jgi:hypothetical protein
LPLRHCATVPFHDDLRVAALSNNKVLSISPWKFADSDKLPRADGQDLVVTQVDVELDLDPDFHRPYLLGQPFLSPSVTRALIRLDDTGLWDEKEDLIPESLFLKDLLWLNSEDSAVSETGESRSSLVVSEPSLDSVQDTADCAESKTTFKSPTPSETNYYSLNSWLDDKIFPCSQCPMAFSRRCDLKYVFILADLIDQS